MARHAAIAATTTARARNESKEHRAARWREPRNAKTHTTTQVTPERTCTKSTLFSEQHPGQRVPELSFDWQPVSRVSSGVEFCARVPFVRPQFALITSPPAHNTSRPRGRELKIPTDRRLQATRKEQKPQTTKVPKPQKTKQKEGKPKRTERPTMTKVDNNSRPTHENKKDKQPTSTTPAETPQEVAAQPTPQAKSAHGVGDEASRHSDTSPQQACASVPTVQKHAACLDHEVKDDGPAAAVLRADGSNDALHLCAMPVAAEPPKVFPMNTRMPTPPAKSDSDGATPRSATTVLRPPPCPNDSVVLAKACGLLFGGPPRELATCHFRQVVQQRSNPSQHCSLQGGVCRTPKTLCVVTHVWTGKVRVKTRPTGRPGVQELADREACVNQINRDLRLATSPETRSIELTNCCSSDRSTAAVCTSRHATRNVIWHCWTAGLCTAPEQVLCTSRHFLVHCNRAMHAEREQLHRPCWINLLQHLVYEISKIVVHPHVVLKSLFPIGALKCNNQMGIIHCFAPTTLRIHGMSLAINEITFRYFCSRSSFCTASLTNGEEPTHRKQMSIIVLKTLAELEKTRRNTKSSNFFRRETRTEMREINLLAIARSCSLSGILHALLSY
eukprot:jgi/Bigna1/79656/fgenesh1_pg.64_\